MSRCHCHFVDDADDDGADGCVLGGEDLAGALESREIDFNGEVIASGVNLGSVQSLPLNVMVLARPWGGGRVKSYVGAGFNATFLYEKSGMLDSTDLTPGFGLAVQGGLDIAVGRRRDRGGSEGQGRRAAELLCLCLSHRGTLGIRFRAPGRTGGSYQMPPCGRAYPP